jgi:alpha-L-fucosidase 2
VKLSRRQFIQTSAVAGVAGSMLNAAAAPALSEGESLDAFSIARRHQLISTPPTPNFFEGMLLGNGDVGACAVVRPDALGVHVGKSDCWDIRVSEDIENHVLTFKEVLDLWARASEEAKKQGRPDMLHLETSIDFFREYTQTVVSSYRKPWPRPWPCGTVWIHWDPRWVQPLRQTLDPSNGLYALQLAVNDASGASRSVNVSCFVDWATGLVSVTSDGPAPFSAVNYVPDLDNTTSAPFGITESDVTPSTLPRPEIDAHAADAFAEFSCFQYFPAIGPTPELPSPSHSDRDRNFSLCGRVAGSWSIEDLAENQDRLKQTGATPPGTLGLREPPGIHLIAGAPQNFRLDLKVVTPRDMLRERLEREAAASRENAPPIAITQDYAFSSAELDTLSHARRESERLFALAIPEIHESSETNWKTFWSRSAVRFDDKELEQIWYRNQYFLACCLRPGSTAPGLFGNWSTGGIGTAWHGDYHMDYNCQQVFWGVFSSNHVEQHAPYFELCQNMMAMSEKTAKEKFELPGAYFPHSVFPVPSQINPYPVPPWGYQISETPWSLQSLWWQYLYTQDVEYLRSAYPMLRSGARFLAAFVQKGGDAKYHIIPTVSSENWGFTVDQRLNKDCILDLALTQFLLRAVVEASAVLAVDEWERAQWREIADNLAPYPKVKGPYGEVWLDVVDAPAEWIYNIPITLAPVFPGEQVGLGLRDDQLEIARRTARTIRLEGGNDVVYQPWIRARLGTLDLDWFKSQVAYCTLPDGVANDRVRQSGGRYSDSTDFDFMMRMGVWVENFVLPGVLNECMLQSYSGTLRLFPNTQNLGPARFENLRAAGAFLVSAAFDGREITQISLLSEKGKPVRLAKPWPGLLRVKKERDASRVSFTTEGDLILFATDAGERYLIERD